MNRLNFFRKVQKLNKALWFRNVSCSPFMLYGDGSAGSGAGKGGGSGGSIRDAGGSFGKKEAFLEEEYFRKLNNRQIKELKDHLEDEIDTHSHEIEKHEEAVKRHKRKIEEIKNLVKDHGK